jgi:hypothetical protein
MWVRIPRDVGDPCTTRTLWCALAAENHRKILAPMPQYYLTLYHLRLCSNKCYRSRMYSRGPLVRFKVCLLYHIYGSFQDQLLDWGLQSFLGYRKFNYMGLILAPSLSLCISQSLSENTRLSRCFWKAPFCRAFVSMSAVFSSVPTC